MKNIFVGVLFFFSLFGVFFPTNAQLVGPTFSVTPSGTTVTATLSGIPSTLPLSQFTYILDTKEVTSIPLNAIPGIPGTTTTKTPVNGSVSWTITGLKGDTTYHIRILETPPTPQTKRFATANTTVKTGSAGEVYFTEAQFKKEGDTKFILSGTVVVEKHKPSDPAPLSTITISGGFYDKTTKDLILQLTPTKPDDKGAYTFLINNPFNNNTNYDLKLSFDSTTGAHGEHTYTVNTGKGYIIPETGKARENFINKNSYRLLAPIPGMTMLLDPELCKLEQEKNPGEICDINAFLNFLLQLAIGAAAVVLVVRIIIDGYGYMISDMPFVKAKLKGRFIDAMIGLVIALSSYLILNTVSPRLVNNDIRIGEVAFDVDIAKELGHQNVVGAPAKLSGDVEGYGPFNVTGDGVIVGSYQSGPNTIKIVNKIYPQEMEKGVLGKVKTIVLHNTMGSTAASGWLEWVKPSNPSSCHFLIEKDGTIWQNARLTKSTNCTGADSEWGITASNSIGIEVVGCAINSKTGKHCDLNVPMDSTVEPPTQQQVQATIYLVNYLNEKFGTTLSNLVTTHGIVRGRSKKKLPAEGQAIYDAIKNSIIKK